MSRVPLTSNCHKRESPSTVKKESTNELDNGKDLNSYNDAVKKQDISLGNWIVRLDMMPNSCDRNNILRTEADSVSSVIRDHRLEIPLLIRIPVSKHSSERKSRLLKLDSNETTALSLPRAGKKRKRSLTNASDKKVKKEKLGKPSISGSTYLRYGTENVMENMIQPVRPDLLSAAVNKDKKIYKRTKTLAKNSKIQTSVRCPAVIQFGKFEVDTCYSCPFPQEEDASKLIFCEFCLKYTKCQSVLERHMRYCLWRTPPGTEIYRNGDLSVFEVDGKVDKKYCETLCRLGKLFLDLKSLDYGVEPFLFYIITKNDGFGCHLIGYFSKIKNNEDNYNVACIVTLPQYRRQGYGRILIELSYLLSKIEKQPGTPEKPLSGLGKLTYCAYWKGVILEYLDKHRAIDHICIKDIINETGLIREDVIDTLYSLNIVVEIYNEITICIDWSVVDGHIKKKNELKQIHIEPDRLRWTPPNKSLNVLCPPDGKGSQRLEKPIFIKCIV